MKIVIADASCLIALDNINEIDLLPKLYEQILVTPEVAAEVGDSMPEWIERRSSTNTSLVFIILLWTLKSERLLRSHWPSKSRTACS